MRQIIQDIKSGKTYLEEIPSPKITKGNILIRTSTSLVSIGTERMLVDFGKASYIQKAKQQPEKVRMVLDKMKTDGIIPTIEAVFNKLGEPIPLGYCNVGTVIEVGEDVQEFKIGDRVSSNGNHAEFVCVPKNLAAKIPDNVSDEEAAFTVIGSIGLQGIRLLNPTFGETIVVIGLGLVGLITAQLLIANGCNVIGVDFDNSKLDIAKSFGVTAINPKNDPTQVKLIQSYTNNIGADGVIITASSNSNDIVSNSAKMCRKNGKVILVGVVGLDIKRSDFYEKEISFQVSCSYGAGRYDDNYEQKGNDYPVAYVRWTEKRNFEAVLNAFSKKKINVTKLITKKVSLDKFSEIYNNLDDKKSIASILEYNKDSKLTSSIKLSSRKFKKDNCFIGIIGAGNFTRSVVLPNLKKLNSDIGYISSLNGLSSTNLAKKFNISNSTTDYNQILKDSKISLVLITTRHNSHAQIVIDAMKSNKNIFVEKPLCIKENELDEIISMYNKSKSNINVGFNRRFSPMAIKMKKMLGHDNNIPININLTVNAGYVDPQSWVQDMETGGGRLIGEACHFVDLCTYFTGSKVERVCMNSMDNNSSLNSDNVSMLLKYYDGSNVIINYFSNGSKSYSKERIEVFYQGRTLIIDNWKTMKGYGFKNFYKMKKIQDKGHYNQFKLLLDNEKKNGSPIIPFDEIVNTTRTIFGAINSLKNNKWTNIK